MKTTTFFAGCMLALCLQLVPLRADAQPTAFEKALYERARYEVLCKVNDDDFASYCVTMNIGGETLLNFHDQILTKQSELTEYINEGLTSDNPKVVAINTDLRILRSEFAAKILEARKGLEIESHIAEATLATLSLYQK
jgi:hypothetical protein